MLQGRKQCAWEMVREREQKNRACYLVGDDNRNDDVLKIRKQLDRGLSFDKWSSETRRIGGLSWD